MNQQFLKITYHLGAKKMNAYIKMPSPTYFVLKKEIELCLFGDRKQPRQEIRTFWIDDDKDEIEIVNQCDYEIFMAKSSGQQHLQVAPINMVVEEPTAAAASTTTSTESKSNQTMIPPAAGSYEFAVHTSVECDSCMMAPIIGFRYKCIQCPNYDLCQNCESKHIHSEHMMVRMPTNNCPSVIDAYITSNAGRKRNKRSKTSCPFAKNGISVVVDADADADVETSTAGGGKAQQSSSSSSANEGKEHHHGRKHHHHRNQHQQRHGIFSHLYEMMHDLAEGGGDAAAAHATGEAEASFKSSTTNNNNNGRSETPKSAKFTTNTHIFGSNDNPIAAAAAAAAARMASQYAHDAASKAADIAVKVACETAAKNASTTPTAGPGSSASTPTAAAFENAEENKESQHAHEAADKAAKIAAKVANEIASNVAKNVAENMTAAFAGTGTGFMGTGTGTGTAATATAFENAEESEKTAETKKVDAATTPCDAGPQAAPNPPVPVVPLDLAQYLIPQYMRTGINILDNFSDMFAKMLDSVGPVPDGQSERNQSNSNSQTDSITPNNKATQSTNPNGSLEETGKNDDKQKPEENITSHVEISDLGSESETENDSVSGSFVKVNVPKNNDNLESADSTSIESAEVTPPKSLDRSNVLDFAQLSADLKAHIAQEAEKAEQVSLKSNESAKEIPEMSNANVSEPETDTTTTNSNTTTGTTTTTATTTTTNNSDERRPVPVYHTDQRINNAVLAMMSMGFSNEGAWLTQLLESVNGNIPEALDVMTVAQRQ